MQDQDILRERTEVPLRDVRSLDLLQERARDPDLAVKAHLDRLVACQRPLLLGLHDALRHGLIHVDSRTAQRDLVKGIAVLRDILQNLVAAEAVGIDKELFGLEALADVRRDQRDVGVTVGKRELLFDVVTVTGRVVDDDRHIPVLFQHIVGKALDRLVVLVTGKAVHTEDDAFDCF